LDSSPQHIPVLLKAVTGLFAGTTAGALVDCTLGLGGHTGALLTANPELRVIGLDVDESNLALARQRLGDFGDRVRYVRANFADLGQALAELGVGKVGGILADLGVSSNQIAEPARGLSFDLDGPLDMRLDLTLTTTAADLVNGLGEGELADLLYLQCQERHSRRIAKRICQARRQGRLNSTVALARLVAAAVGQDPDSRRSRIHPATRTFMALRMSVNHETRSLERLLAQAPGLLAVGGRVAIISFHSVEDRLVKESFREQSRSGVYRLLSKKPIEAEPQEAADNPRSRSAKLRAAELVQCP
jgi:16S rRNA (cytosine1402-N4)-methyltransferase